MTSNETAEVTGAARLSSLLRLAGKLASVTSPEEVARVVVDEGVAALEASMAGMFVVTADRRELVLLRESGFRPQQVLAFQRVPLQSAGPLFDAIREGRPVWIGSREEYAARYPQVEPLHRPNPAPPIAFAILPYFIDGAAAGCLSFVFHDERRLTAADRTYLELLTSHSAEALRRAHIWAELREALADARRARTEAEAANRTKDEFLAMLGHELRNPLAPIATALELMQLREPERLAHERETIARQVAHLSRLVDDLLDVSRITRGKVELRCEHLPLAALVQKAAEMTQPLLASRGHRVALDVPGELRVFADATRLSQVVANLLSNAAKYTPPGGRIEVRARAEAQQVELSVRDDGIGIDPEVLPRIFDIFMQAPQPSARPEGGLGIGLAIVRSLVAAHGGSVEAKSEGQGRGAELIVRLPAPSGSAPPLSQSVTVPRSAARLKVLVVDDNEDAATLLAELLELHGHEVAAAHDGPAALELALRFAPDVAVLDLGLPGMDGYELARQLRASSGVRLIAVTGYGRDSDRRRALEAGFEAHLAKPVAMDALLRLLAGQREAGEPRHARSG